MSTSDLRPLGPPLRPDALLWDACFSPDEHEVVTASTRNELLFWDWQSSEQTRAPVSLHAEPLCVEYAPDGGSVIVLHIDRFIAMIDALRSLFDDHDWMAGLVHPLGADTQASLAEPATLVPSTDDCRDVGLQPHAKGGAGGGCWARPTASSAGCWLSSGSHSQRSPRE